MEFDIVEISPKAAAKYIAESKEYRNMMIDGSPEPEQFTLPDIPCYGAFSKGEMIAVYAMVPHKQGYRVHFQITEDFRQQATEIAEQFIGIHPATLYARVPTQLRTYINFCKKLGFREYAIARNAYTVGGEKRSWQKLVRF